MRMLKKIGSVAAMVAACVVSFPASAAAERAYDPLNLKSSSVLVVDDASGQVLYGKNTDAVVPIASITKLMTAMVTLDAGLPLDEMIEISEEDYDSARGERVRARLAVGTTISREDLLRLALMSSDNRSAAALGRTYPGGLPAFVQAMNAKAYLLGMHDSRFVEPTGLQSANVSSAQDLAKLVRAAHEYPLIRDFSTTPTHAFTINGNFVEHGNTNALVKSGNWEIDVQKTGFIREAGRCLVMYAKLAARPVIIVLLDSVGKYARLADAARIRDWLDPGYDVPEMLTRAERLPHRAPMRLKNAATPKVNRGVNLKVTSTSTRLKGAVTLKVNRGANLKVTSTPTRLKGTVTLKVNKAVPLKVTSAATAPRKHVTARVRIAYRSRVG
ncbi:MAG: D-alanyl-D-alanine endopeptidase [Burkholderiales bacterium]